MLKLLKPSLSLSFCLRFSLQDLQPPVLLLRDGPLLQDPRLVPVHVAPPLDPLLRVGRLCPLALGPPPTPSEGRPLRSRPGLTAHPPACPGERNEPRGFSRESCEDVFKRRC